MNRFSLIFLWAIPWIFFLGFATVFRMRSTDKFSIGGVIAGIYQYQSIDDAPGYENEGRGISEF